MELLAVVIQKNSYTYADCNGRTMYVPAGIDADFHVEYWAVPVKEGGVCKGYRFTIGPSAPTYDSFRVVELVSNVVSGGDTYWVLGSAAQYHASVADEGTTPMPLATTIPVVVLEEASCLSNGTNYQWDWDAPTIPGGEEIRAYVGINNVIQTGGSLTTGGYASLGDLVTALNSLVSSAGTWSSPAAGKLRLLRPKASAEIKIGVSFTVGNYTP